MDFSDELRRLQGVVLLLSSLPPQGKCSEIFRKSLALDHEPMLERLTPYSPNGLHGFQQWLESIWAQDDLSPGEDEVVWWQNDAEGNLAGAIAELKAVSDRTGPEWVVG